MRDKCDVVVDWRFVSRCHLFLYNIRAPTEGIKEIKLSEGGFYNVKSSGFKYFLSCHISQSREYINDAYI